MISFSVCFSHQMGLSVCHWGTALWCSSRGPIGWLYLYAGILPIPW